MIHAARALIAAVAIVNLGVVDPKANEEHVLGPDLDQLSLGISDINNLRDRHVLGGSFVPLRDHVWNSRPADFDLSAVNQV